MKSTFFGFYSIDEESLRNIWKSKSTLFVFDTNCLLNLYRCEDQTRDDILNVMKEIASRSWIPFQVGFEYQKNRRIVIEESINSLNKIQQELESIYKNNILSSCGIKKHLYNSLSDEIQELQEKIKKPIDDYIQNKISPRIASKKSISELDIIRNRIDTIIQDKVGSAPTQEKINAINEEGKTRYANKQPPGFMDENKKESSFFAKVELQDKFGDLYLWKEIIEISKSEKIKNVIFICDDNKKDWWFIQSGKTHGVLESLKTEICNESNIDNFKIINQLTFLHEAKNHLENISIQESSLKEVEELSHIVAPAYSNNKKLRENIITLSRSQNFQRTYGKPFSANKINDSYEDHFLNESALSLLSSANKNILKTASLTINIYKTTNAADDKEDELRLAMGYDVYDSLIYGLKDQIVDMGIISRKLSKLIQQEFILDDKVMSMIYKLNQDLEELIADAELNLSVTNNYLENL